MKPEANVTSIVTAESANNASLNVIATISHEIRTPLHAIMGLAELVKDEIISDTARRHMDKILVASEALLQTLNTSIDAARAGREGLQIEHRTFDLLPVLENATRMFALNAEAKGVSLNLQFDPRLHTTHYIGDAARLLQVISNLLGNAVKFTESGSITLWAALRKETSNGREIFFAVQDTGIGIPAEQIDRITQQFSQVISAQSGRPKGSGLGLFISKKIIELMGGKLDVRSSPEGSRFSFALPMSIAVSHDVAQPSLLPGTLVRVIAEPSVTSELLQSQLRGLGAHVDYSETLRVEHVRQLPDLTLIDVTAITRQPELWQTLQVQAPDNKLVLLCSELDERVSNLQADYLGWFSPHLPSELLEHCRRAGLLAGGNARAQRFDEAKVATRLLKKNLCILCVDDSPTNLIVLKGALKKLGYEDLPQAVNGAKAVEFVTEGNAVDVIFMDFNMPILNGAQAAREIRKFNKSIPIIGLTALSEQEVATDTQAGDFDRVLTKPASAAQIDDAINTVLGGRTDNTTEMEIR